MRLTPILTCAFVLGLAGCHESDFTRPVITTDAGTRTSSCDPSGDFPHFAGSFFVQIFEGTLLVDYEEDSVQSQVTYSFDPVDPLRMNVITDRDIFGNPQFQPFASGDPIDLGSTEFGISAEACEYDAVVCNIRVEIIARRKDDGSLDVLDLERTFQIVNDDALLPGDPGDGGGTNINTSLASGARWMVEEIAGEPVFAFDLLEDVAPVGVPTRHPDARVAPTVPAESFAETVRHGAVVRDLEASDLERVFTGPDASFGTATPADLALAAGFASDATLPLEPGRFALVWQELDGDLPLAEAGGDLEYGLFVAESATAEGGFQARAPFSYDPRHGATHWFTLSRAVGDRWRCAAHRVGPGGPREVPTAARAVVSGRVILWLVPVAELPDAEALWARHGVFWHLGDFGQLGGAWAADCTPHQDLSQHLISYV